MYLRVNMPEGVARYEHYYVTLVSVPPLTGSRKGNAARYMTRMTFQGDNLGHAVGVFADESVYIEGAQSPYPLPDRFARYT